MSLGQVSVLPGLGGSGPVEVREGNFGQVVVTRQDRVVIYQMEEREVEHTWYVDSAGGEVGAAVAARGRHEETAAVVPRGSRVVMAETKTSRLEECGVVEADVQVHQVLDHQQELLVVFCNGGVKTVTALQSAGKGGLVSVKGVLEEGERVVQCQLFQKGTATLLGLLVTDNEDKDMVLVTCRLVLDGDEDRTVVVEEREGVGPKVELLAIHLGTNLNLFSLCKKESVLQKWVGGNWQRIIEVPGVEHAAITSLGQNHLAVMGSLEEGGFLHLVNARYSALVGQSKLKTTQHSGVGLHWVQGTLFLAASSKLLALNVSGLDEGLQGLLGSALPEPSSSPYTVIPELLEKGKTTELVAAIQQIPDLPESLLVACLAFFLDKERSGGLRAEAQLCYISMLLGRVFSEPLAEHEVSSWSLSMVTSLLSLLDTLLLGEGVGGEDCGEAQLLAWVALLLNTHYLQLVVAKDEETRGLVARLMETVASIQESTSILAESRVIAHNIINTKIPPIKHSSQAYCIEVIQI